MHVPTTLPRDRYNAYMRVYMTARYHRRRAMAIALLGGKCVECGTTENLELDHIDPASKTFNVGSRTVSEARYLEELKLCQLLCTHHHKIKTATGNSVEHGGGLSGKKNCKCDPCKEVKRLYYKHTKAGTLAEYKKEFHTRVASSIG
jgi:hypothetical protein